jgi:hypothetical protein
MPWAAIGRRKLTFSAFLVARRVRRLVLVSVLVLVLGI